MPLFDLGTELCVEKSFDADLVQARTKAIEFIESYRTGGCTVVVDEAKTADKAEAVTGHITDANGSDIAVTVDMRDDGRRVHLSVRLRGLVYVGGIKGRLVTRGAVRGVARRELKRYLAESFENVRRPE